ncbi:MAG: hypothetical protein EKK42_13360 [Pseudonocardiaceae bacterium]|nr:MAG: hypothetical protein EKK42_13360 [Pseudonocardiaceae bacterium]
MSGDPKGSRDLHPRDEPDALQPGQDPDDRDDVDDRDDAGSDDRAAGPPDSGTSAGAPTPADGD